MRRSRQCGEENRREPGADRALSMGSNPRVVMASDNTGSCCSSSDRAETRDEVRRTREPRAEAAAHDACCGRWWISSNAPLTTSAIPMSYNARGEGMSGSAEFSRNRQARHHSGAADPSAGEEAAAAASAAQSCTEDLARSAHETSYNFAVCDKRDSRCLDTFSEGPDWKSSAPRFTLGHEQGIRKRRWANGRTATGSGVHRWEQSAILMAAFVLFAVWQPAGSWIALSNEGYTIKHNLIAEAGITITGDMRVNGVLMSKPVENIACTPDRAGSMRWNDKYFESCDGVSDWQPVEFCDRSCNVNTFAVPCGVAVLNKCDVDCEQTGTGLNMRQCLLRTAVSTCNVEVTDNCGNPCGLLGQFDCDSQQMAYGGVVVKSLEGMPSTAGFEFTVGADKTAENRDSLFLTYKNLGGISQALTMIRRLADHASGMEFAKPPGQPDATMRVSMMAELTGELIKLGESPAHSQLFVDGVLDKECPLVFSGVDGPGDGNVTKLCLETPTQQRTLTLPDASGTVITSGNREDVRFLPGLEGDNSFVYTGAVRDLGDMRVPPKPRVTCEDFSCTRSAFSMPTGVEHRNCSSLDYADHVFDLFRVYYMLDDGHDVLLEPELKEKLSFDTPTIRASAQIRQALKDLWAPYWNHTAFERPRLDLLLQFMRMSAEEAGMDTSGALGDDIDMLVKMLTFGDVAGFERCFVCCGNDEDVSHGIAPPQRKRPKFCVGGDNDGSVCEPFRPDCPHGGACLCPGGGSCVNDPAMSCYEHDFGIQCYDLTRRPNFTTTVNFTEPSVQRSLLVPDSSGTFITTGNLEDITSVGVLTSSIVSQSTNTTTTTLQFQRCLSDDEAGRGACGMQQVSSVLQNNTLLVPSAADGILLTTGNLEDVSLDSGSMTGLSIATDLHVNGLLQFGDPSSSGIRLPPRVSSQHYSTPSGNQHPGNANVGDGRGPGQLSFLLEKAGQGGTTRVFEFEPRDPSDPSTTSFITVPARNGTAISTGNLESVTQEAGSMTSISVGGSSYLEGGLSLGKSSVYGQQTLLLQGSVDETIVHRNPLRIDAPPDPETGIKPPDLWSTTKVGFQMHPKSRSDLEFPATSGKIITTGNLHDISEFSGQLLNVSGASHLRGPVRLGKNRTTPISFSGYVEGDIVSRSAPRRRDRGTDVEYVPPPNTWGHNRLSFCENKLPAAVNVDTLGGRLALFPSWERYNGSWTGDKSWGNSHMSPEYTTTRGVMIFNQPAGCRQACLGKPNKQCGIVMRSRYLRGSIRMYGSSRFLTALPHSACPNHLPSGTLHGVEWSGAFECQRAALVDLNPTVTDLISDWGSEHMALADIDVVVARCRNPFGDDWMPCWHMEACGGTASWQLKTCEVSLRQHFTGAFLGTQAGTRCYSHGAADAEAVAARKPVGFDNERSLCTGWRTEAALWRFEAAGGGQQHLARVGTCAEVDAVLIPSARITCDWSAGDGAVPDESLLDSFEMFDWGMNRSGVCGAYNASKHSCLRPEDEARWLAAQRSLCLEPYTDASGGTVKVPGCYVNMKTSGNVEIVRADTRGLPMVEAWKEPEDAEHTARFAPAVSCRAEHSRVVVQARCRQERYLSVVDVPNDGMSKLAVSLAGGGGQAKSSFQMSTLQAMDAASETPAADLLHECWLTFTAGPNCYLETHMDWDVDFYMRDESTRLSFAAPSDSRNQWFPDADGTIITSGNVEQISHLRGLEGANTFIFASGSQPGDASTIIDFAAMGTAPSTRRSGQLPQYQTPDGKLAHTYPESGGSRLVFPDATGTVITTGNTDDLVFKSINLEGLEVQLEANFGIPGSPDPTILSFAASSRISGCFNFVDTEGDTAYTQLCAIPPTRNNRIDLPDVSGVVLTTGNLKGLPNIKIPDEHMFVGGDVSLEGSIELGHPNNISTMELFTWIDGDIGLTVQSAGGILDEAAGGAGARKISSNVLQLTVPHMSGLDRAMRAYMAREAKELSVDVQHSAAFRSPINGTQRVNQSLCFSLLSELNVRNFHALGYFLTGHHVLIATLLRGRPYAALLDENLTEYLLPNEDAQVPAAECAGDEGPNDCSTTRFSCGDPPKFGGEGGTHESGQRNRATAAGWERPGGYLAKEDSRCAFDGDISTNFESSRVSSLASASALTEGRCVIGMTLSGARKLSRFRIYVRKGFGETMVGARLQGFVPPAHADDSSNAPPNASSSSSSSSASSAGHWEELFLFERAVREEEWNDIDLSAARVPRASPAAAHIPAGNDTFLGPAQFSTYSKVRFVGAACGKHGVRDGVPCRCDVAEMEWHHGYISQQLSPLELGTRSFFVDHSRVAAKAQVAMVLKCAYMGWYPDHLTSAKQELALPETSGHLLTTGNLRDVTIEAGAITSLGVKGDVYVGGNSVFGEKGSASTLEIHSSIEGRFPLSMSDASNPSASLTLTVPDPTGDSFIHLPDESGTIVTTGSLPAVVDRMVVVGGATLQGKVRMEGDVVIGDKLNAGGVLEVHAPLTNSFPLSFAGASPADQLLTLSVETPTAERVLTLPDVSGTVLTTGSMPNVIESTFFTGESVFRGGATFLEEDVVLGTRDAASGERGAATLELHAVLQGASPLHFEGLSADNRTLTIAVEEPSGRNTITLPDVSGTIITTGNFPDVVERLRILGDATFEGDSKLTGQHVRLGRKDAAGKLEINARITGRFPLTFSDADAEGRGGSTTLEITPPTGNNIISFPDTTGTVITTGNIPSSVMLPDDDYTIQAQAFVAAAPSVAIGVNAVPPKHRGSFVYTDGYAPPPRSSSDGAGEGSRESDKPPPFTSRADNSFNVRATGGVKFVTGYTPAGRPLGVVLNSGSSAWSVLSDRESKEQVAPVDVRKVLDTLLAQVPISKWSYDGDEEVRHIGPMAQDFFDAFGLGDSRRHISSIDADGVAMAALQGLHAVHAEVSNEVKTLEEEARKVEEQVKRNADILAAQERQIAEAESALKVMMEMIAGMAGGAVAQAPLA